MYVNCLRTSYLEFFCSLFRKLDCSVVSLSSMSYLVTLIPRMTCQGDFQKDSDYGQNPMFQQPFFQGFLKLFFFWFVCFGLVGFRTDVLFCKSRNLFTSKKRARTAAHLLHTTQGPFLKEVPFSWKLLKIGTVSDGHKKRACNSSAIHINFFVKTSTVEDVKFFMICTSYPVDYVNQMH